MVSHPLILLFYALSGIINSLMGIFNKKTIENNYFINNSGIMYRESPFIDDQTKETALRYGSKPFSHSGCGTAAVYNALLLLKKPLPLPEIIRHFERNGASLFAAFGTAPQSAVKFLNSLGLNTKKTANRKKFPVLAYDSDILIFTIMNNRRSIFRMLHTMCIEHLRPGTADTHHTERGAERFIVHNSHGRSETYANFDDMMNSLGDGNGRAEGVYMIGIKTEDQT